MSNKKILVLDSVSDVSEMLNMHLEGYGYQSVSKTNWVQALRHINEWNPDAIVLGFGLKPEQACEVLTILNEEFIQTRKSIPVVILGLVEENSRGAGVLENFSNLFLRFCPYETNSLYAHVENLLDAASGAAA